MLQSNSESFIVSMLEFPPRTQFDYLLLLQKKKIAQQTIRKPSLPKVFYYVLFVKRRTIFTYVVLCILFVSYKMLPIFLMLNIQYILRVDTSVIKLQQVNAKSDLQVY